MIIGKISFRKEGILMIDEEKTVNGDEEETPADGEEAKAE